MGEAFWEAPGFVLQEKPPIYSVSLPGNWLLKHTTPSWRIEDPFSGFQRIVREERAKQIAMSVLDQRRTFPNAIVLASDTAVFQCSDSLVEIPNNVKFLVVDGQHRLWAQHYASFEATYACIIHTDMTEVDMARLFIEINDNQKRVPSSLRWDLVRLVRPEDDPLAVGAAEMIYQLATNDESPLFQRVDLTGEQSEISLKQGSLAPEIKRLLTSKSPLHGLSFDEQYTVFLQYFTAIRELDQDGWISGDSAFYKARVLRGMIRLLADLINKEGKKPTDLRYTDYFRYISKIDPSSLGAEKIRASQGSAGIKAIYDEIRRQSIG
ncbi:MAG: DGQHR domain-containing protein [Spirochaetales bacterium]|jgi:DGQHR domain-containing protein|nr:DGQHR domain-containing protein [Spirochaetales bacterium]